MLFACVQRQDGKPLAVRLVVSLKVCWIEAGTKAASRMGLAPPQLVPNHPQPTLDMMGTLRERARRSAQRFLATQRHGARFRTSQPCQWASLPTIESSAPVPTSTTPYIDPLFTHLPYFTEGLTSSIKDRRDSLKILILPLHYRRGYYLKIVKWDR